MASPQQMRGQAGATNLRFGDIIVALLLLGVLLYAAWKQFPAYRPRPGNQNTAAQSVPQP
jgi:hypothetical protein